AAHGNASLVELVGDRQCSFTTQDHQRIDAHDLHVGDRFLVDAFDVALRSFAGRLHEASAIACSEDRAAPRQEPAHVAGRERSSASSTKQTLESVLDSDHAHAVFAGGSFHHRANYCIEAGCITAASQDSDGSEHGAKSIIADLGI